MFFLSEIEHTFRLRPHLLDQPLKDAIKGELDSLFLDKVIEKLGLCISIYDIRSIDGGFIVPGDGASMYTVRFRLVMFRPFVGEVISARLKESTKDGLRLSVGFFDDIYIPSALLPTPNHYVPDPEHKDGVKWNWEYDGGETYPIDWDDEIRFRVLSVTYPPLPLGQEVDSEGKEDSEKKDSKEEPSDTKAAAPSSLQKGMKPFAPMVVKGTIDSEGFGPISWWV